MSSRNHLARSGVARLVPLAGLLLLSGCKMVVLSPSGDVAHQQGRLILASTFLMLLIIVPVISMILLFAWRYRAGNGDAHYDPEWHHSTRLEVGIWSAPLAIIIALGLLTWVSTHVLDPYRTLTRITSGKPVSNPQSLRVDVVAMDWKWLFIYPDLGIATVNEMAAPVNMPIAFHLTSTSVMNSFSVPALAGQIYAMAGMQTQLHAVMNQPGDYEGFSANYSGAGFSDMKFRFRSLDQAGFQDWVRQARASGNTLDRNTYLAMEKPSEKEPVRRFATVDNGLFDAVLAMCVDPAKACHNDMARTEPAALARPDANAPNRQ